MLNENELIHDIEKALNSKNPLAMSMFKQLELMNAIDYPECYK